MHIGRTVGRRSWTLQKGPARLDVSRMVRLYGAEVAAEVLHRLIGPARSRFKHGLRKGAAS
jgi:hypothetical protein